MKLVAPKVSLELSRIFEIFHRQTIGEKLFWYYVYKRFFKKCINVRKLSYKTAFYFKLHYHYNKMYYFFISVIYPLGH